MYICLYTISVYFNLIIDSMKSICARAEGRCLKDEDYDSKEMKDERRKVAVVIKDKKMSCSQRLMTKWVKGLLSV